MQVFVNQKSVQTEAKNIAELVSQLELPAQGVAVAVDNHLVRRTEWESFALQEGAQITIIKAACGG